MFQPGDEIEFLSGDGEWKRGTVVVPIMYFNGGLAANSHPKHVRIHVGNGIHIIRPARKCRMSQKPPIDVKPNTAPPVFVFQQTVDTPGGKRTMDHEGFAPVAMEAALVLLIKEVKRLAKVNTELHVEINVLRTKGETDKPTPQPASSSVKGGKGR